MDTSIDHTSTLEFLLAQGKSPSASPDEYFAQLLFSVLHELKEGGTLADIIGNHRLNDCSNSKLNSAMLAESRGIKRPDDIRVREIYKASRPITNTRTGDDVIESYVYLACTRWSAFWLLVEKRTSDDNVDDAYKLTDLDPRSMAAFFAHYQFADHIGRQILRGLQGFARSQEGVWFEKQRRLNKAMTLLDMTSECSAIAQMNPRAVGNGIEG